ncbi:MAG TPA: D-alanyl-D-alanine carboxypeptidase/D-alanyl-D-alanine-endopeptidase [Candidatus Acidoferrales bacterium]
MKRSSIYWRRFVRMGSAAVVFVLAALFGAAVSAQRPGVNHKWIRGGQSAAGGVTAFRERVDAELSKVDAARAYWGILIADADTGETLYEVNSDHYFAPASDAKIFTTALALATLGPDYRIRTTLESQGALRSDGHLTGDLILVGRGDPDISNRKFSHSVRAEREGPAEEPLAEMADRAVAKGLREVDGDIVADDSYFPYDPYPAGWTVGDLFFKFGAPISAIDFNDNTVSVEVQPGPRMGEPATILTEPRAAIDTMSYEIATGPAGGESEFAVVRQPGPKFILLRGTIPLNASPVKLDLSMTEPAETSALALKQLLEARGVRVTGGTRAEHAPPPENTPSGEPIIPRVSSSPDRPNATILVEHASQPLSEIVRVTNKESQNLHAELLLRAVGHERTGVGSTAAGLQAERAFLKGVGIADGDVVLSDGSGLSPGDLVTPRAMVTLLRHAAAQPWGRDFISSLPVAGVDGTLEYRMNKTAASGRIEAKTGEIEHTRALSGYATTMRGEHLVFAIFYNNNPRSGAGTSAPIDAVANAMVEMLGAPSSKKKR